MNLKYFVETKLPDTKLTGETYQARLWYYILCSHPTPAWPFL